MSNTFLPQEIFFLILTTVGPPISSCFAFSKTTHKMLDMTLGTCGALAFHVHLLTIYVFFFSQTSTRVHQILTSTHNHE